MPKKDTQSPRIVLALSGGGFRATLFHLGVIRYLRNSDRLKSVVHVSGVSGGAILAAHLVSKWSAFSDSSKDHDLKFQAAAKPLIKLTQRNIRGRILLSIPVQLLLTPLLAALQGLIWLLERIPWLGGTLKRWELKHRLRPRNTQDSLQSHLRRFFKDTEHMQDLPLEGDAPSLSIHATNLTKGSACAFLASTDQQDGRRTVTYWYEDRSDDGIEVRSKDCHELKLGKAVAYSACFPGVFPPRYLTPRDIGRTADEGSFEHLLTDGGVYDNLGLRLLESLTSDSEPDQLIISDASAPLTLAEGPQVLKMWLFFWQFKRAVGILLGRVGSLEKALRFTPGTGGSTRGIGGLSTHLVELSDGNSFPDITNKRRLSLGRLRTDLDGFSKTEVDQLVVHGQRVAAFSLDGMHREDTSKDSPSLSGSLDFWSPFPARLPISRRGKKWIRSWIDSQLASGQRSGLSSLLVMSSPLSWLYAIVLLPLAIAGFTLFVRGQENFDVKDPVRRYYDVVGIQGEGHGAFCNSPADQSPWISICRALDLK